VQKNSPATDAATVSVAPSSHLNALDGLRGLAALIVMIAHSAYAYRDSVAPVGLLSSLLRTTYRVAHPAVVLFFVLSGFVLYVAFRRKPVPYVAYLVRRMFRIYPALLAGIALALVLHVLQSPAPQPGLGPWTTGNWVFSTDAVMVARHLLMIGVLPADIRLNPVIWSLVIELRFSIAFVALAWLCRRSPWGLLALSLAAYGVGRFLLWRLGLDEPYLVGRTPLGAIAVTFFYLPGFSFGLIAAHFFLERPQARLWRMPVWAQILTLLAALAVAKVAGDDLVWAAAFTVMILLACLKGPLGTFLGHGPSLFFGRISYSLYLIHFPILMTLVYALHPVAPLALAVLLAPTVSILAAVAMYRWIELPGMEQGRRMAAAIARPHKGGFDAAGSTIAPGRPPPE
jgi:peptidoglycan/LPS O-acetylase OafA/YrhL